MIKYESLRKKLLSNPEVQKEYKTSALEYEVAYALISARVKANMTQSEVAEKMNTTQSVIARLESGKHFPSLQTIYRYAIAVDRSIERN
ncbi:helix-turn-helix transcriptional regulator [Candidatus Tisiphia endosymbiont of Temnostethus pusillus]|uniref:helix-turn-helix transcriptional regulator n=1 Tax=Candidatus Tisiphia endosymbiont of Temnostethus pusillus TaxID=3139335 RepID=UPI0035C91D42